MIPRKRAKPRRRPANSCSVPRCKSHREKIAVGDRLLCSSHALQEADRLFSLLVRAVAECERCGKRDGLQCSHFISRRYLGTRWVRLNAECLCVGCHKFLTERPIEARDRARELLGATVYDELEDRARRFTGPVDYAAIIANGGAQP